MTKSSINELAKSLANKRNLDSETALAFVENFFDILKESLGREKNVKIKGFGTFKIITVSARKSIDVNTGETIELASREKISFVPDGTMRDLVNRPFAQFDTVVLNDGVDFSAIDQAASTLSESISEDAEDGSSIELHSTEQVIIPDASQDVNSPQPSDTNNVHQSNDSEITNETHKKSTDTPINTLGISTKKQAEEDKSPDENVAANEVVPSNRNTILYDILHQQNEQLSESNKLLRKQLKYAHRIIHIVAIGIITCILIIIGGLIYIFPNIKTSEEEKPIIANKIHGSAKIPTKIKHIANSSNTAPKTEKEKCQKDSTKKTSAKHDANCKSLATQYDNDARVRTGAYRIIGVRTTVKVRAGQTLSSISKYYLGAGMECYVEAFNGIKDVKEGQIIKIPDLKIKHK